MEAGLSEKEDTNREDVESDGKLSEEAFGLKKKISCQFTDGEQWAVHFEEEESDVEEMSEEEADLRRELKWKSWQLTLANLWGSHNTAHIAVGCFGASHKVGGAKSEAMDTTVQRAKTEAAQILMEARKIEEAYAAAGESDDPDLIEMSEEVDRLGDLGVELHELWNSRKGEESTKGCDKTRQVESLIKAVGTGKALEVNASTSIL